MFDLGNFIDLLIMLMVAGIFGLFLVLLNFFMLRTYRESADRENATQTWPSVTGVIGTSEARTHSHERRRSAPFPHVSYTYEVNGHTYHSSNILAGGEIGGMNVKSTLARYPPGSKVTVYYDPQNPKDAVLEPGKKTVSNGIWLMLAAMNLIVCIAAVWTLRDMVK